MHPFPHLLESSLSGLKLGQLVVEPLLQRIGHQSVLGIDPIELLGGAVGGVLRRFDGQPCLLDGLAVLLIASLLGQARRRARTAAMTRPPISGRACPVSLRDEQRIEPAPEVISRTLDGEAVLLDLGSGTYFGLNEVGTKAWELMGEGCTWGELKARLLDEYEVDAATVECDLGELIATLAERGLVTVGG